jgi:hypothetical protein
MLMHTGNAALAAVLVAVTGCSSTGGTLGGLLPMPKLLKGSIVDNVYMAKDGAFRVACPHDKGSYEYKYMAVKEVYTPNGDYVSFGPAAFDQSIYRVDVTGTVDEKGVAMSFETAALKVVTAIRGELEKGYGTDLVWKEKGAAMLNGRNALTWTYVQSVPSRITIQGPTSAETLTHQVVAIESGNVMVVLWVQTLASCRNCEGKAARFFDSFEFGR